MYNKRCRGNYQPTPRPHESYNTTCSQCFQSDRKICEYESRPSLAMVYPVSQKWQLINDGCAGFERGTIFDELHKPFAGDKCRKNNC